MPSHVLSQDRDRSEYTKRREALEELIRTEGWRILLSHFIDEWEGLGYKQRMRNALRVDLSEAKVVDRVAQEIAKFLQWPGDQVKELKGAVDE